MNCLDFRRHKLADPRRLPADAQAHLRACPTCAAFSCEVDEAEAALERSLAVPVPEGLAERAILHAHAPRRAWRRWALAAAVLLAMAIGALRFLWQPAQPNVDAPLAIEHVVMEPESFTTVRNADAQRFRAVVQEFGGTLQELPGTIRYIRLCPVEGGYGWHIVFETPQGLATLLLVPGKPLPASQSASTASWSALARPVRGGYYAIVTPSADATARFDKRVRDCIHWA
jgi:hypothetical protein